MPRYISSVSVTLAPKDVFSLEPMITKILLVDVTIGASLLHVLNYVNKNPLVRQYLNKYHIINLTFQYSES